LLSALIRSFYSPSLFTSQTSAIALWCATEVEFKSMIKSINYLHLSHHHRVHLAPPRGSVSDPTKVLIQLLLLMKNFFLFSRNNSASNILLLRYSDDLLIWVYFSFVTQVHLSPRYLHSFNLFLPLILLFLLDSFIFYSCCEL